MNNNKDKVKLTRKQKAFADELLNDKKLSGTKAALRTYNTTNRTSASIIAMDNLANPSIQAYLNSHDYESQSTIVEMMSQRDDKRLAFDAAKDIQDRIHGKATQNVHTTTEGVSLVIDLTSSLANSKT